MARIIKPSRPLWPVLEQPTMTLAGEMTEPNAAPVVCAARIVRTSRCKRLAVRICSMTKTTLELVLLPVMNAPKAPMNGETSGKAAPTALANPRASRSVRPAWLIIAAMPTMAMMPKVGSIRLRSVVVRMRRPAPGLYQPAAVYTPKASSEVSARTIPVWLRNEIARPASAGVT